MAKRVSVERASVQGGIACCKTSIRELEEAARNLRRRYQEAGSGGWKDQKYTALGTIVSDCCGALTKPVGELQECMRKLEELLRAINAYEQIGL